MCSMNMFRVLQMHRGEDAESYTRKNYYFYGLLFLAQYHG